jgi:hypothetical protein
MGRKIHGMNDRTKVRRAAGFHAGGDADGGLARVAAAIGEPARARMLCCLLDGHARTGTELAIVAQGKHRYYSLQGTNVARALEGLSVVAGEGLRRRRFEPSTPSRLRAARTCYDHIAGTLGVGLHDGMHAMDWLRTDGKGFRGGYELTRKGAAALAAMGVDVDAMRATRRRFAFGCLDWSERRPHVGGALGAALLDIAVGRKWVVQDLDSRALEITQRGRREMMARFGVRL